ncbi:MAG: peptidylprolyl isomerase [bacterium]
MLPEHKTTLIIILLVSLFLGACKGKETSSAKTAPSPEPNISIVAAINSEPITRKEFSWRFKALTGYNIKTPPVSRKELSSLKKNFLEELVIKKILLQEAAHLGYSLEEKEFETGIEDLLKDYSKETMKDKIAEFKKDAHRNLLMRENLLIRKLINREINGKVLVKKSELFRYFKRHPGEFVRPEKVHVLQILLSSEEEADKLHRQLKEKKTDFAKLARERAKQEKGFMNGDLGIIKRGQVSEEFDKRAFSLKKGETSDVFKTEFGYHIIKVTKKIKPEKISFYVAKPIILKKLMKKRADIAYRKWIKKLRARSTVKINVDFF